MSQLPFPRKILNQHSATLGKTGAGKSSALRVSVEPHQSPLGSMITTRFFSVKSCCLIETRIRHQALGDSSIQIP